MTPTELPAGLMLVHGNQAESLRDLLVAWMRSRPLAPLACETVLVQSNGIAQWLRLALAAEQEEGGCGIAAALEFSLPSRFLWQVYRAVLGREAVPETSPFDESRLVWRLMRLLPELLGEPVYLPLRRFLDEDADLRKRYQLAGRLADLFDQYQVYRADWLAAWAAGDDVLIDARGNRQPLADEQRWQAALWRRLLADVDAGAVAGSASCGGRAAVHAAFLQRVQAWPADAPRPVGLPQRVLVFGISSLPRQSLEVLAGLARWSQVLMCVHNPCRHYWADIVAGRDLLRATRARQQRRADQPAQFSDDDLHLHAQPLLAAWGKQGRDFIALLDEHDDQQARAGYAAHFQAIGQRIDLFSEPRTPGTLLHQLQDDILDLRPLAERRQQPGVLDPARDDSVRFHVAHSPQREVEVLHDQLLAAFNADPALRPRDIIVMVPDIDTYAPHIQAVFGLAGRDDPRYIPFSLADQGRRRVDPLLQALERLLGLPQSRLAVSDLLDLLEVPALRRRFGIDEHDLPQLHRWIRGANVRWGLHASQRASLQLPAEQDEAAHNSWLFGLRRMLLGYAVGAAAQPWLGIEPYDEVGGLDAALLGPLASLLARLDDTWHTFSQPARAGDWCARLRALLADFFLVEEGGEGGDAYTLSRLELALQDWEGACRDAAMDELLPFSVVAENWLAALDQGGLSQRFFAGAVTFATLMPMRAIPFRLVCLLGMNDGDYPRVRQPLDFDLMGRDYRPGDRSRREDDRYLFLEALLSARDRLYISWVGRSINDNSPRPPSVLVGQLRDHLAEGWRSDAPGGLLAALTTEHPLQPFSPAYFPPAAGPGGLFTYASEWRIAHRVLPSGPAPALPPLQRGEPLTLREVGDFLKDPVKAFFRQRLEVVLHLDDPASEDVEPFQLDNLQAWQLQNELIQHQARALERGEDPAVACQTALDAFRRRGELPAGAFGDRVAATLAQPMAALFDAYRTQLARWPQRLAQEVEIAWACACTGGEVVLVDWLGGLRRNEAGEYGRVLIESSDLVKKSEYRSDRMIAHWVAHLAAHLVLGPLTTVVVSKAGQIELLPRDPAEARERLEELLRAWCEGMRRPLPLAVRSGFAWLKKLPQVATAADREDGALPVQALAPDAQRAAHDAARLAYEGDGYNTPGECAANPYLRRTYPDYAALSGSGEFDQLARQLLGPLLQAVHAAAEARRAARKGGGA